MARKQKPEEPGPSKAYLVSFGDTMTTLLAFFIVLCSLAEDQTGANLYSGTGSFVRAMESMGLPGAFSGDTSSKAIELEETNPLYLADSGDVEPEPNGSGPDQEDNGLRSLDREKEEYQRFLREMDRLFNVQPLPSTDGEVVFDFFEPLKPDPPYLSDSYSDVLARVNSLLRRDDRQVELIVWATTPSPTAWRRAADQAYAIADRITTSAKLTRKQRGRLRAVGRPWIHKDAKRPVLSFVFRRVT